MIRRVAAGGIVALVVGGSALALASGSLAAAFQEAFPHERHEGLFPTCTGCHGGIPTGDVASYYPDVASCGACHDRQGLPRVDLPSPRPRPSNLVFTHPEHAQAARAAGAPEPGCRRCHGVAGAERSMAVGPASAEACLGCHAHEAPSHLAEGRDCTTCHRPLTEARELPAARIARLPIPETHQREDFLLGHDPGEATTRCATCHARESCTRCHLDGAALAPVRALAPDPRVASLAATRPPAYPRPPSHRVSDWRWGHGGAAGRDADECASCHERSSCTSCHREAAVPAIAALPLAPEGDPRGVRLGEAGPLHAPGYALDHGAAAAADRACSSCHQSDECEACHAGSDSPPFHLPNFLERHGPEAYSAATDCATCHNTEVFCRSCHEGVGLGDNRLPGVTGHDARPLWLVGHGTAARQGLEGCVTCHDQGDCATCHSAAFGWRVNPHGPGFDPVQARDANPFSCARCHIGGGGAP